MAPGPTGPIRVPDIKVDISEDGGKTFLVHMEPLQEGLAVARSSNHVERWTSSPADGVDPAALPKDIKKSFTIDQSWNSGKLSFVAFLQTDTTKEVLQACTYGYGGNSVPEIGPLFVIPLGGLFVAVLAAASRKDKKGADIGGK